MLHEYSVDVQQETDTFQSQNTHFQKSFVEECAKPALDLHSGPTANYSFLEIFDVLKSNTTNISLPKYDGV